MTITEQSVSNRTVHEPEREVRVCQEADVVVVGGGAAGCAAAVAAARNGASTALLERYGIQGNVKSTANTDSGTGD